MILDLTSLEASIAQLDEILTAYGREPYKSDPATRRYLRAGAIQTFEFTYETTFKMLKRHLALTLSDPKEIDYMTFDEIIRKAFGKDLVRSDISAWRKYRENRGITSHTYDEEKAQRVFESASDFLQEARYALTQLQGRNESLDDPN